MILSIFSRPSDVAAYRLKNARFSTSEDEFTDQLALDWYEETRLDSTYATGVIRLARPSGGATQIPIGNRFGMPASASRPAVLYAARETVPVPSGTLTVDVPVVAIQPGEAANQTDPTVVTQIVDPIPPSTPASTWTIDTPNTSAYRIGGGRTRENDDQFKSRVRKGTPTDTRQRGTRVACETGMRRVASVTESVLIEPNDGMIAVYAGDENFVQTDEMYADIVSEMDDWRALGCPLSCRTFTVTDLVIDADLYMSRPAANFDQARLANLAAQAVKRYFDEREYPDEYFVERIEAAISSVHVLAQKSVVNTINGGAPADVRRASSYGAVPSVTRYRVKIDNITVRVLDPLTQ